jgi:formamidopyrimidine-DNA glycosylase
MPELPEVETTRRGLLPRLSGRRIEVVTVRDRRLRWPVPDNLEHVLAGMTIEDIDRRGKYLLLRVTQGRRMDHLMIHLGMTGSLQVTGSTATAGRHDHIDAQLSDGQLLRYHDPRRFGAWLWAGKAWQDHPLLAHLGPEPFDPEFNSEYLQARLKGRQQNIKALIMDAGIVTGVGNIYANEALFRARIHPAAAGGRISRARLEALVERIREVLQEAIAAGGSSIRDYVQSDGASGWFQLNYAVYGRDGEPCPACSRPVRVDRSGQRATFFCGTCQRR